MNKIIYSAQVMLELVERGHRPLYSMPNPKYPEYTCWVFENDESFQESLNVVLGGRANGK